MMFICPVPFRLFSFQERIITMENTPSSFTKRIGKTTFIVNVKQSETAKKPLESKFRDLCIHAVLGDFATSKFNLENLKKIS